MTWTVIPNAKSFLRIFRKNVTFLGQKYRQCGKEKYSIERYSITLADNEYILTQNYFNNSRVIVKLYKNNRVILILKFTKIGTTFDDDLWDIRGKTSNIDLVFRWKLIEA